jgi:hypothetical protein
MTTRLMVTTAIAAACLAAAAACTRSAVPFAGASYSIRECPTGIVPKTVYKIELSEDFNLRNPQVTKSTRPAKADGHGDYDEDYAAPETPYTWPSDALNKTRLDVDVGLTARGEAAMIKIVLDDSLLEFRTDDAVIRGGNEHGRDMLCSVRRSTTEKSVRFIVFYYKPNPTKTYGKYNIGLIAKDLDTKSGYTLPVYIDPMIKNNG